MIKALIFDFDGVLVDSEPLHFATEKYLVEKYGAKFNRKAYENTLGRSIVDCITYYRSIFDIRLSTKTLLKEHDQIFLDMVDKKLRLISGVKRLIRMLKKNNYLYAIASSANMAFIAKALKKFNLYGEFRRRITGIEKVQKGKPAPDLFLCCAKQIGMAPESCLVLEDALNGVEAAVNAQMHCLYLGKQKLPEKFLMKVKHISNLSEIDPFLLKRFAQ